MFDGNLRGQVDKRTAPIGNFLSKVGITADTLTAAGLVMSVVAAAFLALSLFPLAFLALLLSALPDLLDGPVAKALGTSSARGAFFDSVSDRFSDLMIALGLAVHYISVHHPYDAMIPFGIYGAASIISYQRAKAESLGFNAKGGLMERAERVVLLALGILIYPILTPVLWLVLVLSMVTVVQRFVKVWRQATDRDNLRAKRASRRTRVSNNPPFSVTFREKFRSEKGFDLSAFMDRRSERRSLHRRTSRAKKG
ncbi:MAG: CDP-alcohol phosphatidyltransferase family protein [Actinomycetota bacterium]|nr:CDP-alcohol phosphatidyltransferase family protein [Actinomycetota bacterium]